jgi:putative sterol carrier protein
MFATDEWAKVLQTKLNSSEAYKKAAAKWEGDFYFVVKKGEGVSEDVYMYLDLWHGEARDAYLEVDPSSKKPAFTLQAPLEIWKGVLDKKIDPIRGIMTRQLQLKGNMMKIMKAPKAATELVECAASVDTEWPA